MRKSLPLYLAGMVLVFLFSGVMYGIAKRVDKKIYQRIQDKDARILELEERLSRCVEVDPEAQSCAGAVQEADFWKELAEQCVDEKVRVKAR